MRDRDLAMCEAAHGAIGSGDEPVLERNSLKPCFVLTRIGTRAKRGPPAARARPRARDACARSAGCAAAAAQARTDRGRSASATRPWGRPARASRSRTRARPAPPRAARACAHPSRAGAAAEERRGGAPRSRRCPTPSGRSGLRSSCGGEHLVRPVLDRVVAAHALAQLGAERGAAAGAELVEVAHTRAWSSAARRPHGRRIAVRAQRRRS